MKMIAGFLTPSNGSISVCGFDVEAQPLEAKRCIGRDTASLKKLPQKNFPWVKRVSRLLLGTLRHDCYAASDNQAR